LTRFLYTAPFDRLEDLNHKTSQRIKVLEEKLNTQLTGEFGALQEKIDELLATIEEKQSDTFK